MANRRKKGQKGAVTNYISRSQTIKKLQLSLPDFRRLCILKGIYPVEPNNKKKLTGGSTANKTYYYVKDIQYLSHEPVLQKFREFKSFMKRFRKAVGKQDFSTADRMEDAKPVYKLDHIVKERYPTFIDALRDLDDALCMVFLFSRCAFSGLKHTKPMVAKCENLCMEFENYIVRTGSLRKVFLSIKGIYYQAEVMGQTLTWIVPYRFTQKQPEDVDFKIMLTFLEIYSCLLGFVNFNLYHMENLRYPPVLDQNLADGGAGLSAFVLQSSQNASILEPVLDEKQTAAEDSTLSEEQRKIQIQESQKRIRSLHQAFAKIQAEPSEEDKTQDEKEDPQEDFVVVNDPSSGNLDCPNLSSLFSQCRFFLSREVPKDSLEFVIKSFQGKTSWEFGSGATYNVNDTCITHQIVDREVVPNPISGRIYVQPQWIYDCINAGKLLPTENYAPGKSLPPHLSPFVEPPQETSLPAEAADEEEPLEKNSSAIVDEDVYSKELELESCGVVTSQAESRAAKRKAPKEISPESEEKELAKIMMPKKHKRLYDRIMHSQKKKKAEESKLENKRIALQQKQQNNQN
eukprot:Sdes_comp22498_c0_seq1m20945